MAACEEPNCFARLLNNARAKCLSLQEIGGNIFCVLRDIAVTIAAIKDKYEEEADSEKMYSWWSETWSYVEKVTVSRRPVFYVPVTGVIKKIIVTWTEAPDDPGVNPITFNVLKDNVSIHGAPLISSTLFYELPLNVAVLKGQLIEIQITDSPDLPSGDDNWTGMGIFVFVE